MNKVFISVVFLAIHAFGYWGFDAQGVVRTFPADKKMAALTLDACGGSAKSSGYDKAFIDFLIENKIPATLFINARWIDTNPAIFAKLASNPLFDIQNHGTKHKPLSLCGESAYGIEGTKNVAEVREEVLGNHEKIKALTGSTMRFFRAGTAHYDDESVKIVNALGYQIIGFAINADAGATNSAKQIGIEMSKTKSGDIIIAHMNHPESQNAKGLSLALKKMKANGWQFVKLSDVLH